MNCLFKGLNVLNTGIQENVENKPVFDSDFDTELINKHENDDKGYLLIHQFLKIKTAIKIEKLINKLNLFIRRKHGSRIKTKDKEN